MGKEKSEKSESRISEILAANNYGGIGCGYDISEGISPTGVRGRIFNVVHDKENQGLVLSRMEGSTEVRSQIAADTMARGTLLKIKGSSVDEFLQDYSLKMGVSGSYAGVAGSADAFMRNIKTVRSTASIMKVRRVLQMGAFTLPLDYAKFVLPQCREYLENPDIAPAQIFEAYGTHFLTKVVTGGYAECNVILRTSKTTVSDQLDTNLSLGFETLSSASNSDDDGEDDGGKGKNKKKGGAKGAGLSGKISLESMRKTESLLQRESDNHNWLSVGGNVTLSSWKGLDSWAASVKSQQVLCDLGDRKPIPIWTLVQNAERAKALEAAAGPYLEERRKQLPVPRAPVGLKLVKTTALRPLFTDSGMRCIRDLTIYEPERRAGQQNCWFLGHVAEGHYGNNRLSTFMVRDTDKNGLALASPEDCRLIWKDTGSGLDRDWSLWEMVPPENYVALGHVFSPSHAKPDLSNFRCVHRELLAEAKLTESIWSNHLKPQTMTIAAMTVCRQGQGRCSA